MLKWGLCICRGHRNLWFINTVPELLWLFNCLQSWTSLLGLYTFAPFGATNNSTSTSTTSFTWGPVKLFVMSFDFIKGQVTSYGPKVLVSFLKILLYLLLSYSRLFLDQDQCANLLIELSDMLASIIEEKQFIMELMLVLLLFFLPDHHLVFLSLRVLVDAFSEITTLFLNILYLCIKSPFNL